VACTVTNCIRPTLAYSKHQCASASPRSAESCLLRVLSGTVIHSKFRPNHGSKCNGMQFNGMAYMGPSGKYVTLYRSGGICVILRPLCSWPMRYIPRPLHTPPPHILSFVNFGANSFIAAIQHIMNDHLVPQTFSPFCYIYAAVIYIIICL